MRKPWSISTTVRNPERLRGFLDVLKRFEGEEFNEDTQIKFQVGLIQERLYQPLNIPKKYKKYYEELLPIPYEAAAEIFELKTYKDPPMRGRQSANPLNKLGLAIARQGYGPVRITELGNKFLAGDYDIGFVFFKSLLKLQFPNPWSTEFSESVGFDVMPLIAVMKLIHKLNLNSPKQGLDKTEFSFFIPTLINASEIDMQIKAILKYRMLSKRARQEFMYNSAKRFYAVKELPMKKVKNLRDYGDNIMRYFRLTRYFKVSFDPTGNYWTFDLEPSRLVEIEQLLKIYDGHAVRFEKIEDYLSYLADIRQPELPWEKIENLKEVALSLRDLISGQIRQQGLGLTGEQQRLLSYDILTLTKGQLEDYTSRLRAFNLQLRESIRKTALAGNMQMIEHTIKLLRNSKLLKEYEPEQFEKLISDALKMINDEILIKPNYPIDDNGEPISHSPANKPDLECFYRTFKAICEVTLNTSKSQWIQEGQPVMRHLRAFEVEHPKDDIFCVFVAPQIHNDTYNQFWFSVKYEYDGVSQKIVPLTTDQFAVLLETLLELLRAGKKYGHAELYSFYSEIINDTKQLKGFSEWSESIPKAVNKWRQKLVAL